jgi:hypothetical protein
MVSSGALSPAFAPGTLSYKTGVRVSVYFPTTITVTAKATSARAKVRVAGAVVASGSPSAAIAIKDGPNPIEITVTSEDETAEAKYTVVVQGALGTEPDDYLKASTPSRSAEFGTAVSLSGDTLAIGAPKESSAARGVNGNEHDTSASGSGAVYIFVRQNNRWSQQAYLKASNARANAAFGSALALDGDTLVVGSRGESSGARGVNGGVAAEADASSARAGAAYVFTREGNTWSQTAYLKSRSPSVDANFGFALALKGKTLAVGAPHFQTVELFIGEGSNWLAQAELAPFRRPMGGEPHTAFGCALSLSGDRLAVGAATDQGAAPEWTSPEHPVVTMANSGTVYLFKRAGMAWSPETYVRASKPREYGQFGMSVALDGDRLAVGAPGDSSGSVGINGNEADTSAKDSGAAYMFSRNASGWAQVTYIKAPETVRDLSFGSAVVLGNSMLGVRAAGLPNRAGVGSTLVVGGTYTLVPVGSSWAAGAVLPDRVDGWASLSGGLALGNDILVRCESYDSSSSPGVNGNRSDTSLLNSGACRVYR